MLAPLYVAWLMERFHWRAAYVGLGLVLLLLTWPLVFFFLKEAPETEAAAISSPAQDGLTLAAALRTRQFWVLITSIACAYLAAAALIANLVPALTDQGFDLSTAAFIQSVIGATIIIGRLVVGYLIDYFWAPGVAAVSLTLPIIACVIFQGEPTYVMAVAGAACIGFATGAEFDLMAFLTARYFGVRHFGKIYAVYFAMFSLTSGMAPLLFARLQEHLASYATGFAVAGGLFALAAVTILAMGSYPNTGVVPARTPAPFKS
jgi:MFS family permease